MVNRRLDCLLEASKLGFTLKADPSGARNRCFYQCIAKHLQMMENEVFDMVQTFMLSNQYINNVNEDGTEENQDLMQFISDADFTNLNKRPSTWKDAVLALRREMANHVVIRSTASIFSLNMNIVDWRG
ncbi:hypothetical protein QZH41_011199, partial [Actinostola sp. cb2023]